MVNVTDNAKQELKKKLLAHTDDPEIGLRLAPGASGQLGLLLGREAEGDQVIEHDGLKVLLVGSEIAQRLQDRAIDVQDTPDGPKLVIVKSQGD